MSCYSFTQLCLTPCNHIHCSTPGSSVLCYLLEFAQIHVHWVNGAIYLTILSSAALFSFCLHSFPASRSFNELALCIQVAKVLEYIVICFYSKSNELYHAVWCLIIWGGKWDRESVFQLRYRVALESIEMSGLVLFLTFRQSNPLCPAVVLGRCPKDQ